MTKKLLGLLLILHGLGATSVDADTNRAAIPWNMASLAMAPEWKKLERPKEEGVQALQFTGPSFQGKQTRVFAWLGLPKTSAGEKVPAMVLIHGGGGTAFEEWVRLWVGRGYAAMAMDTCGQIPVGTYGHWIHDTESGPAGWGGFDQINGPQQDQWTYHAVADAILAHSLIRSLPEVDPKRIGVTGISWGGYLTCLVASIDHRFKLAVPVYGCGFYRDTIFQNELKKLSPDKADQWMSCWDPSSYLAEAEMPFLWVTGSNDFAYPMDALQLSYRLAPGPRTLCLRLRMPHGHGGAGENPEEIRVFVDSLLKNGKPLAHITGAGRMGREAWATYESPLPIQKAELNFTTAKGRWQDRAWESIAVQPENGKLKATLPEGTTVYYFNLFDDRNCAVSSEHEVME
jgi:dienelactone hydrolase